jgi:hypothetical protein
MVLGFFGPDGLEIIHLFDFAHAEVDLNLVVLDLDVVAGDFTDDRDLNLQPDDRPILDHRQPELEVLHDLA